MFTKRQRTLLDSPLAELQPLWEGSDHWLFADIEHCYSIIQALGIKLKKHFWVSDDWFTPDGIPGMATPFYLLNDELVSLYRREVGEVEGHRRGQRLKVIVHELGHVVDNAFGLRRTSLRKEAFGSSASKYPKSYTPRPDNKYGFDFLGDSYYQAHSDEDFAETFASWVYGCKRFNSSRLNSNQARKKEMFLQMLDRFVFNRGQVCKNNRVADPIEVQERTLREFLSQRKLELGIRRRRHLTKNFLSKMEAFQTRGLDLASYIENHRPRLANKLRVSLGVKRSTADSLVLSLARESKLHKAKANCSQALLDKKVLDFIADDSLPYIKQGYHRIVL